MPHIRNAGKFGKPTYNQAQKIITRFGGEAQTAKLIGVSRTTIYRWQYKRPYGSDGLIPSSQIAKIRDVARVQGILLTEKDWLPERNHYEPENIYD